MGGTAARNPLLGMNESVIFRDRIPDFSFIGDHPGRFSYGKRARGSGAARRERRGVPVCPCIRSAAHCTRALPIFLSGSFFAPEMDSLKPALYQNAASCSRPGSIHRERRSRDFSGVIHLSLQAPKNNKTSDMAQWPYRRCQKHGSTPWFHSNGRKAPGPLTAANRPEILRRSRSAGSPRLPADGSAAGAFHRFPTKNAHSQRRFFSGAGCSGYFSRLHVPYCPQSGLISIIIHFWKKSTLIFRLSCRRRNNAVPPRHTGTPRSG